MTWEPADPRPVPVGEFVVAQDPAVPAPRASLLVAGELDPATAPTLRRALTDLVDRGYLHLEVDLERVHFCDSSGLYALVAARDDLRGRGGTVTLAKPCRSLSLLLDHFRLTTTLDSRSTPGPQAPSTVRGASTVPLSRSPR